MPKGMSKKKHPHLYNKNAARVKVPVVPTVVAEVKPPKRKTVHRLSMENQQKLIKFIQDKDIARISAANIFATAKTELGLPNLTIGNVQGARMKVLSQPKLESRSLAKRVEHLEKIITQLCNEIGVTPVV